MFLQAAGMPHCKVRPVADRLEFDGLSDRQKILADFAWKASVAPLSFCYEDSLSARRVLDNEGEFLEAALVTAGFSFANRCADALGVRTEVPAFLREWPEARWRVMRLLIWAIRLRTDFANRPVKRPCPDEVLEQLRTTMAQAGIGDLPPFFERLRPRPDLLEVQATATKAALLENGLGREVNLRLAYLVSAVNRDSCWMESAARQLRRMQVPVEPMDAIALGRTDVDDLSPLQREMLLFARDIALQPDRTTDAQVTRLRALGLTDPLILDLVAVCAAVSAGNRLNRMLVPASEQDGATPRAYALVSQ